MTQNSNSATVNLLQFNSHCSVTYYICASDRNDE